MKLINFVDTEPKKIYEDIIAKFQKELGEPLLQGDERRIFLEQFIPIILSLKNDINFTGNQNLLRYAEGKYLDAIGDMFNVARFGNAPAQTMLEFSIDTPFSFDVNIPKGSRATADGEVFFATKEDVIIKAGDTSVITIAECTINGTFANGITIGQINAMVDLIPYIVKVKNTVETFGANDIESDNDYRERIRLSPERFSTAGPTGAYEFYAKSASHLVKDVYITSPLPGEVEVYITSSDTIIPTADLIKTVDEILSADSIRPLTDHVTVKSAVPINFDVVLTYYPKQNSNISDVDLQKAVEQAVTDFKGNVNLGADINPDELKYSILKAGAYRVDIISPVYTPLQKNEVAIMQNSTITKGV